MSTPGLSLTPALAAAQELGETIEPEHPGGLGIAPNGKKRYPSPMQFRGNAWAAKINSFLDDLDTPPPDAKFQNVASETMVGECSMATLASFTGGDDLNTVHPGVWLTLSLCAYAAVVFMHRTAPREPVAPVEGGNRFDGAA